MFSRKTSVLFLGSALLALLVSSGTALASWQAKLDEAKATAYVEGKPVLIDFYTDW